MRLNKIILVVEKEFTQYYHFPILEALFIIVMIYFSLNAFHFMSNLKAAPSITGGHSFTLPPSSEMIDRIIPLFLSSLGVCSSGTLLTVILIIPTALTIAGAFERNEVITILSYPIHRTEFIVVKILLALIIGILLLVMPVALITFSIFPVRDIAIAGLLGWLLSIMEVIAITSLIAVTTKRTILSTLITLFVFPFIDYISTNPNVSYLKDVINPSRVLMDYLNPISRPWMHRVGLQDILFSIGAGILIFIVCILLSIWYIKKVDVS